MNIPSLAPIHINDHVCAQCQSAVVPGVVFPASPYGRKDRAYVAKCQECDAFHDDVAAGKVLAVTLTHSLHITTDGQYYIAGLTFAQAEKLQHPRDAR